MVGTEALRVAGRALRYRRAQTLVTMLVVAVLAAVAAAAPWYARLVRDQQTTAMLATGSADGAWRVTSLQQEVPDELRLDHPLATDYVAGVSAELEWWGEDSTEWGEGGLLARDDLCAHVTLVAGACPGRPGEVAVSSVDVEAWGFEVGERLRINPAAEDPEPLTLRIAGVYRVTDPGSPYWYQLLPTGRSGYRDQEIPVADRFLTVTGTFAAHPDLEGSGHLDGRVDADRVTAADLPALRRVWARLGDRVDGAGSVATTEFGRAEAAASLDGQLPTAIDTLEERFEVADGVLVLTFGQVAALGLVVLSLLASRVAGSRRKDIALRRLRGQPARRVTAAVTGEWLVVGLPAAVLGTGLAAGVVALARARWLPDAPLWPPPLPAGLGAGAVLLVGALFVAGFAHRTARQPIPDLLRVTAPRAGGGSWTLDLVLVTAAACALLVGLTSGDGSTLVLLAPVLLALAVGVVVARAVAVVGARVGRWSVGRRPTVALSALEVARGGGLRATLVVPAVVVALVVLATQTALVGDRNRDHRAEVETGADRVYTTDASALAVQQALDEVDPDRERATVVARAGRVDGRVRTLYVEPAAFARIAYGAREAAAPAEWRRIAAPGASRPELRGSRLRVHLDGSTTGPVTLWLRYTDAGGVGREVSAGTLRPGVRGRVFTVPVHCDRWCRLVGWTFSPEGDAELRGSLRVEAGGEAGWRPVRLAAADWKPALPSASGYRLELAQDDAGLALDLESGGLSVVLQAADTPAVLPALVSAEHASTVRHGLEVPTPANRRLPIRVEGTLADATPQQLVDTVIADVSAITRYGETTSSADTVVEVWLAPGADDAALVRALADRGVELDLAADVVDARATYDRSAEALAARVNPAVAALALLLAAGCLLLWIAGAWRARAADLGALQLAGVPRGLLRRATYLSFLVPCLVGVLTGALAGTLGTAVAIRRMRIFGEPEPAIRAELGLLPVPLLVAVLVTCAVLTGIAVVAAGALARRVSGPGEEVR